MKKLLLLVSLWAGVLCASELCIYDAESSAKFLQKQGKFKMYQIVEEPQMLVIGIACRTSNNSDAGPKDIPKLWEQFYSENIANKIPQKASNEVVALYCDYEGDYTKPYSCVIGCPVKSLKEIPEGMVGKIVPAAKFAVFSAKGEFPKSLIDTWGIIWSSDLKRTYIGDYEVYGDKFFTEQQVDIFIAVE